MPVGFSSKFALRSPECECHCRQPSVCRWALLSCLNNCVVCEAVWFRSSGPCQQSAYEVGGHAMTQVSQAQRRDQRRQQSVPATDHAVSSSARHQDRPRRRGNPSPAGSGAPSVPGSSAQTNTHGPWIHRCFGASDGIGKSLDRVVTPVIGVVDWLAEPRLDSSPGSSGSARMWSRH